jgi:hypothetical protein
MGKAPSTNPTAMIKAILCGESPSVAAASFEAIFLTSAPP